MSTEKPVKIKAAPTDHTWCRQIFDALDFAQDGGSGFAIEKEPDWVCNILRELVQQAAPAICLRKPKGFLPRELGLYLGQQCANLYAMGTMFEEATPDKLEAGKRALNLFENHRDKPGVESLLTLLSQLESWTQNFESTVETFEQTLHNAFKAALTQPDYSQAVQFFQGFATGIAKPGLSRSGLARTTTATLIYQKLFTHRREVENLSNYPTLREFLIRNGVNENLVGSIRRLQKLCERIGLRLAKRGRPRKSRKLRPVS